MYKIGDTQKDIWSGFYSFTTQSSELTEFSFIGVTDSQSKNEEQFAYYTKHLIKLQMINQMRHLW